MNFERIESFSKFVLPLFCERRALAAQRRSDPIRKSYKSQKLTVTEEGATTCKNERKIWQEIKENSRLDAFNYLHKKKLFYYAEFYKEPSFKKYEAVQFILKFNDTNYKTYGVNAGIFIDGKQCPKELDKGKKELSDFFEKYTKMSNEGRNKLLKKLGLIF